jgi:hypothetical protein
MSSDHSEEEGGSKIENKIEPKEKKSKTKVPESKLQHHTTLEQWKKDIEKMANYREHVQKWGLFDPPKFKIDEELGLEVGKNGILCFFSNGLDNNKSF